MDLITLRAGGAGLLLAPAAARIGRALVLVLRRHAAFRAPASEPDRRADPP